MTSIHRDDGSSLVELQRDLDEKTRVFNRAPFYTRCRQARLLSKDEDWPWISQEWQNVLHALESFLKAQKNAK